MKFILTILLGITTLAISHAREVKLKFSVVQLKGKSSKLQMPSGDLVQLRARYPSQLTEVTISNETNELLIYSETANLEDETTKPICRVKIPADLKIGNVLLFPYPGEKHKAYRLYSAFILDYSQFKGGGLCFFNAAPDPVGVMLGEKKMRIPPRKMKTYNANLSGAKNFEALMATIHKDGSTKDIFHKGQWRLVPSTREIMVIYNDPKMEKIRVRAIVDH